MIDGESLRVGESIDIVKALDGKPGRCVGGSLRLVAERGEGAVVGRGGCFCFDDRRDAEGVRTDERGMSETGEEASESMGDERRVPFESPAAGAGASLLAGLLRQLIPAGEQGSLAGSVI
jgi:hypothetical protein